MFFISMRLGGGGGEKKLVAPTSVVGIPPLRNPGPLLLWGSVVADKGNICFQQFFHSLFFQVDNDAAGRNYPRYLRYMGNNQTAVTRHRYARRHGDLHDTDHQIGQRTFPPLCTDRRDDRFALHICGNHI